MEIPKINVGGIIGALGKLSALKDLIVLINDLKQWEILSVPCKRAWNEIKAALVEIRKAVDEVKQTAIATPNKLDDNLIPLVDLIAKGFDGLLIFVGAYDDYLKLRKLDTEVAPK